MLESVRSLLEPIFDSVVMVAAPDSLLDAARKLSPDLIVVDLSFPVPGGVNAIRYIRDHCSGARIISLSVHDEPTVAVQALASGAAGFVLKRSAGDDLVPAVNSVLRGGTYVSPAVRVHGPESGSRGPKNP